MLDAAWHFSYFKSPDEIVHKFASFSTPRTKPPYNQPAFHRANALRCIQPEHADWKFRYVPVVTDVPRFALRNPCHMHVVFDYERDAQQEGLPEKK